MSENYLKINRELWDAKTPIHFDSDFYNTEAFLKKKNSLNPIEEGLLGDISGKRILHLQCHFGQDSISLALKGAKVTAVDFSGEAIQRGKDLAAKMKAKVNFIQSDVYSLPRTLSEKYDVVFTSYGVISWLPDLNKWAEIIAHFLKPNGQFMIVEFHPVLWMFDDDFKQIQFPYSSKEAIVEHLEGTYTGDETTIKKQSVCWNHSLADVIQNLIQKNFIISHFQEYNYSPYNCFANTTEMNKNKYQIKGLEGKIPMLFSLTAFLNSISK